MEFQKDKIKLIWIPAFVALVLMGLPYLIVYLNMGIIDKMIIDNQTRNTLLFVLFLGANISYVMTFSFLLKSHYTYKLVYKIITIVALLITLLISCFSLIYLLDEATFYFARFTFYYLSHFALLGLCLLPFITFLTSIRVKEEE